MRRKGYKFTNKSHTRRGIASSGIGLAVLLALSGLFYISYQQSGNIGVYAGVLGFFSMLGAVIGLVLAVQGLREEDRYYLFSYIGCVLNGFLVIGWILLYIWGM